MGIEPTYPAWKAGVLPLNYTRISYVAFVSNEVHYTLLRPTCQHLFFFLYKTVYNTDNGSDQRTQIDHCLKFLLHNGQYQSLQLFNLHGIDLVAYHFSDVHLLQQRRKVRIHIF